MEATFQEVRRHLGVETQRRIILLNVLSTNPDRQAAEVIRARIRLELDWKYVLGLQLTDPGFDFSVVSGFRSLLIESVESGKERLILENLLEA